MTNELITQNTVENRIYLIRNKKVMLDSDLASLYSIETKALKQAVRRNAKRFPDDFMFCLTNQELSSLRSQFVTLEGNKGPKYLPYVFTEQGVAMLSGVLHSDRAIEVNIQIMRTFTNLREMLLTNEMLRHKIESMEKNYDHQFNIVFSAIKNILEKPITTTRRIGFTTRHESE